MGVDETGVNRCEIAYSNFCTALLEDYNCLHHCCSDHGVMISKASPTFITSV